MDIILLALFLAGACLGSFCNVVIIRHIASMDSGGLGLRSPASRWGVGGRSHCPACGGQLRWWELIPIGSFIFLRARCRRCRAKISWQYPVVELAMGFFTLAAVNPLPGTTADAAPAALSIIIATLLIILFVIDLKTMFLPDKFVGLLLIAVLGILLFRITNQDARITNAIAGAAIGAGFLLLLWLLTRGRGIGLGDVKLMLPLGLLFGPLGTAALLFLAYAAGGLLAIYLLARKKAHLKTAVPFGPFLCGAALLLLVFPALPGQLLTLLLGYNPWP